ncbi:hypothetical protein [uncultured Winogradskyella sp.]|uniref:hypothetical protein n=1 Tax=uncultured Winogradskyella sp. TaxID=395353 RepID=UPI0026211E1E|nr:hypothetical protein [uncultured Winogradskyella sp.]
MKKISVLLVVLLIFTSCSKEEANVNEQIVNDEAFSKSNITNIENEIRKIDFSNVANWDENQSKTILMPVINETIKLLNNEGISNQEIIDEFGSLDNPEILYLSMGIVEYEGQSSYQKGDTVDCLLRATGLDAFHQGFWNSFSNRRALLRAVGRVATRTLGWFGAALIVADFAHCMWG